MPIGKLSRSLPQHVEAYPSFSMAGVAAQVRVANAYCEWQDEGLGLAGQMDVRSCTDHELFILFSCGGDTYRHQRGYRFDIRAHRQWSGRVEPRLLCPACSLLRVRLLFKSGRWACQRCHGLVERRSLLTEEQKLILRRQQLIEQVHTRPLTNRTYNTVRRLELELMAINGVYAGRAVPRLEPPLCHALRPFWFGSEDERTEREPHDLAAAYLDVR